MALVDKRQTKFVNCDICGKRCKGTGLHVHKRVHRIPDALGAANDDLFEIAEVNKIVEQLEEVVVQEIAHL